MKKYLFIIFIIFTGLVVITCNSKTEDVITNQEKDKEAEKEKVTIVELGSISQARLIKNP